MDETINIITFFLIYSFIGWILESTYKSILQKRIVSSGFLNGPVCPIYGCGALIIYYFLKDVSDNVFILFILGTIVLSFFEYLVGLFLEIVFKTKYWDYSNRKFNIQGRVCLQNSLYWGALGIVFMKLIHPAVEKTIISISMPYMFLVDLILITTMTVDTIFTVIGLVKINVKLKNWEQITENIRNRIEEINLRRIAEIEKIKKLRHRGEILGDLKLKQQMMQNKLEERLTKLRKAFPTMKSERLSNFLENIKKSQKR